MHKSAMGKFYETTSTFNYSWDQIVRAFWARYPNPFSSHILSEDTISREMRGDALYSLRLLTKTYRLPRWGQRFVKANTVPIVEESYINPVTKIITTYTRNIGYSRFLSVVEKVTYTPDPDNTQNTITHRSGWISSGLYGLRRAVEKLGVENFRKHCTQTAHGFNYVLSKLYHPAGSKDAETNLNDGATPKENEVPKGGLFQGIMKLPKSIFTSSADTKSGSSGS